MYHSGNRSISIFLPSLEGGGAERVLILLANGLVERGYPVTLILGEKKGPYLDEVSKRIQVTDLNRTGVMASFLPLIRVISETKPTMLITTMIHSNLACIMAAAISNLITQDHTKVIVREANVETMQSGIKQRILTALAGLIYPLANRVVAVSRDVEVDLRRIPRIREKITKIPNPIDIYNVKRLAEEPITHSWFARERETIVIGLGRLTRQKGFQTLIEAMSIVNRTMPVKLVIFGEGDERLALEKRIEELGLSEQVSLPGFKSNPFPELKASDVFVLSSRWEGMPNVVLQALALGVNVVATDCPGGVSELLNDGQLGRLTPVGDAERMARRIIEQIASSHPVLPKNWLDEHDPRHFIKSFEALFEEI